MSAETQVHLKQVWKRKKDGLLVRVSGLIFLEPRRVMWQALPNQGHPAAHEIIMETEFQEQYEYQPQTRARQS
jgi:hypothetical protein